MIPCILYSIKGKNNRDRKQFSGYWGSECGEGTDYRELWRDNKNVLYFYCCGGYNTVYICQNFKRVNYM